jgi:hypothetical protein
VLITGSVTLVGQAFSILGTENGAL